MVLTKLGDVLETELFTEGEHIVREGTVGDTFYILASGEVRVTQGETVVRWVYCVYCPVSSHYCVHVHPSLDFYTIAASDKF